MTLSECILVFFFLVFFWVPSSIYTSSRCSYHSILRLYSANAEGGYTSSVISPEQSEDGVHHAASDSSGQQPSANPPQQEYHYQQAHTSAPSQQQEQQQQPHLAPAPALHQQTHHPVQGTHDHSVPVAYAQAPGQSVQGHALAPAPSMNGYGITLAPNGQQLQQAPVGHPAQNLVVHQHGNYPAAKRQRVEGAPESLVALQPGVVPSAAPASIVAGGQQLVAAAQAAAAAQGRGKKSQAQIDRRRERNRILARRTRLRKKFFFESLQKEVMDLQRQNTALKDLVKSRLPSDESRQVLETCKASEKLPEAVVEACGEHAAEMDQQDFNLVRSVQQSQHSFIITDPCLQDNPIVYASDGFLKVTGYAREDVLGRNCRFLQGPETSKSKVDQIRRGLEVAEDTTVTLVNYMADDTPFWNKLFIAALRDSSNNIVNFIGVVVKVANPPEGDPEFGKVLTEEDQQTDTEAPNGAHQALEANLGAVMASAPGI